MDPNYMAKKLVSFMEVRMLKKRFKQIIFATM